MKIEEPNKEGILKLKSFCIYGLGATGMSVVNYFNKNNFMRYDVWDDNISAKTKLNNFSMKLDKANFIVISPGISIKKAKLKKKTYKKRK